MTTSPDPAGTAATDAPAPGRSSLNPGAVLLLVLTGVLAALVVGVSYGLAREYGDTTAPTVRVAAGALRDWSLAVVLVVAVAGWTVAVGRRSRGRRTLSWLAVSVVAGTLLAVPAGAVLGVQQKLEGYPEVPSCTDGFDGGPAVPVVRAAEAAFAELDHPGAFSGGGSSGIDGCTSQLMVGPEVDVSTAYRSTLVERGWTVRRDEPGTVTATRDGQDFEASRDRHGAWRVWIGPAGLRSAVTAPGEVAPRS